MKKPVIFFMVGVLVGAFGLSKLMAAPQPAVTAKKEVILGHRITSYGEEQLVFKQAISKHFK